MKLRVLSAALLLPVILGLILWGGWLFRGLIAVAVLLAGLEYVQMLHRKGYKLSLPLLWATILLWLAAVIWPDNRWLEIGLPLIMLAGGAWQLFHCDDKDPTATWALTLAGGLYLGIGGAYLLRLRVLPDGLWWILTALLGVWIADSGAYFVGRKWGRHKIAPHISPGKSWEGYAAEIVTGLLGGYLLGTLWPWVAGQPLTLTPWRGLWLGLLLAALTPLGDFFVSMIKREVGVKDSGKLIPGHGGAFDRLDSLLWAGILTWWFVQSLG